LSTGPLGRENKDDLGHLVRSVVDAWVDPGAGHWVDRRKEADHDCRFGIGPRFTRWKADRVPVARTLRLCTRARRGRAAGRLAPGWPGLVDRELVDVVWANAGNILY